MFRLCFYTGKAQVQEGQLLSLVAVLAKLHAVGRGQAFTAADLVNPSSCSIVLKWS